MPTLLLRSVAPLQAWDTQSNFSIRTTGREPTKSGIIGLLCAALGRPRIEPVNDLAELKMGVRADQEGVILRDWHTALDVYKASGRQPAYPKHPKFTTISNRYYLSDAAFLVGLESPNRALLETLQDALRAPHWMLFLGRKACPPSMPVYIQNGIKESDLRTTLENHPWFGMYKKRYDKLKKDNSRGVRIILEKDDGERVHNDQPISFEKGNRQFAPRRVHVDWIDFPKFAEKEVQA